MATVKPKETLLDQIREQEEILLGLGTTFATLKAFEKELVARVGSGRFVIANTMVWEAMIAQRDLLMIRFASWVRSLLEQGGFFGQLKAHYLGDLRRAWKQRKPTGTDPMGIITGKHRSARIEARFSTAVAHDQIDPVDIDAVSTAVRMHFKPVVDDRDSFRAHPHDGEAKPDAKALRLGEVEAYLVAAQDLMNDLRLAVDHSTFGYHPATHTDVETSAKDLVDLLLFHGVMQLMMFTGSNAHLKSADGKWWWQRRDAFLAELARQHAAHPELPINDHSLVHAASEAMAPTS